MANDGESPRGTSLIRTTVIGFPQHLEADVWEQNILVHIVSIYPEIRFPNLDASYWYNYIASEIILHSQKSRAKSMCFHTSISTDLALGTYNIKEVD